MLYEVITGKGKALLSRALTERIAPQIASGPKKGFSIPLKRFVVEERMFRTERDVDVLGAFRVKADAVKRVLDPRKDHHVITSYSIHYTKLYDRPATRPRPTR